jgi:hypothetical protein
MILQHDHDKTITALALKITGDRTDVIERSGLDVRPPGERATSKSTRERSVEP